MAEEEINKIIKNIEKKYSLKLLKLNRKKIIYSDNTKNIIIVMPTSKIYKRGNGWIDLTRIQISLINEYSKQLAIFRLKNGKSYFIDMKKLIPLLTLPVMLQYHRNQL